jgi:ABC-type multidrug transport system fused ATPase/permease subunit
VDVKEIPSRQLMDMVSFVFQDSKLLKMSIYDNVRMGKKDATREEVMEAFLKKYDNINVVYCEKTAHHELISQSR